MSFCCVVAMVNNAGESPKDLAKRYGHQNCIDLLGGNSGEIYIVSTQCEADSPLSCHFYLKYELQVKIHHLVT